MIEFAAEHIRPRFLLKCDDDSFVRVGSIMQELPKEGGESFLYWGYFDGRAPIITKVCCLFFYCNLKGLSHETDLAFDDMYGQF
jgi:hypothetical protein